MIFHTSNLIFLAKPRGWQFVKPGFTCFGLYSRPLVATANLTARTFETTSSHCYHMCVGKEVVVFLQRSGRGSSPGPRASEEDALYTPPSPHLFSKYPLRLFTPLCIFAGIIILELSSPDQASRNSSIFNMKPIKKLQNTPLLTGSYKGFTYDRRFFVVSY